jgi:hypothetical protein
MKVGDRPYHNPSVLFRRTQNFIKSLSEIPNSKIYNQEYPTQIRAIIKKKFIPLFLINFCSFDKFSFLEK